MAPIDGWFTLEAVYAGKGDALILHYGTKTRPRWILIDGGHTGVYDGFLRPRLEEIRLANPGRLDADHRLPLEMVMVSHADEDHLLGVLDLTANLRSEDPGQPRAPVSVDQLWFNGFSDLIAGKPGAGEPDAEEASILDGLARTASFGGPGGLPIPASMRGDRDLRAVVASTAQGRRLLKDAEFLVIDVNKQHDGGLVMRGGEHGSSVALTGGLKLRILGPDEERIDKLRRRWKKDLEKILKKEQSTAEAAAFSDASPFNLSSIMVLVERGGRRMLLTGDGRGDDLRDGLEAEGLLDAAGRIEVDLFKVPHHGSSRNVKEETFSDITAAHYLISANGEHDNPDPAMLDMLKNGRAMARSDEYTLHLTFPEAAFELIPEELANAKPAVRKQKNALEAVDRWLKDERPSNMKVVYRDRQRPSLAIEFGERVLPG
jgi:hypothetical protein